jgi:DNA polymerase-4/DNA polymerase V
MLLHVDGDAFFASVYQATHPETKGKPVVIGRERGIATAISYEAKKYGIKRGMLIHEIKKLCPSCYVVTSDYETYELFCRRMIEIALSYTPSVERYSIDEIFVDITDLPAMMNISYAEIGQRMKNEIEKSLGITVSAGVALTKCLAKIGSNYNKPSGFAMVHGENLISCLKNTDIADVWGIGYRTAPKMKALGIYTAWDLYNEPLEIVEESFNKLIIEIWHELHGKQIYELSTDKKTTYKSIMRSNTVVPATTDYQVLLARIYDHVERSFLKARRLEYQVGKLSIFLKTQSFTYHSIDVKLPHKTQYPFLIRDPIKKAFEKLYRKNTPYRATGCTLSDLEKITEAQQSLFNYNNTLEDRLKKLYPLYDKRHIRFGSSLFDKKLKDEKQFMKTPSINLSRLL